MAEMTLEQRRAIAMANARMRASQAEQSVEIPTERQPAPQSFGRQLAGVTIPTATSIGGGLIGAPGGPVGSAVGAGAGYAAGEAALRAFDIAQGNAPEETPMQGVMHGVKDIALGTSMEGIGNKVAPYVVKGAGWFMDALGKQLGTQKAAKLIKEAFGTGEEAAKQLAKAAPQDLTAAQSIAKLNAPTAQALLERVSARTPMSAANKLSTAEAQEAVRLNRLADLAGGESQTAAKGAQKGSKVSLNNQLIPTLNTELKAANTAGELMPKFENDLQRNAYMSGVKAEEAKFATGATGKTSERYTTELKDLAAKQAADAEAGKLLFDEAGRFTKQAMDSLASHGLKPLESKTIVGSIGDVLKRPEYAGNREVRLALTRVGKDIKDWTNAGGVIDARALDSIRKNSINSVVQALLPNAEAKAQKALAAKLTGEVRPLIVDAIESAGGTGYGQYLKDYAKGMQEIGQQKLNAKALDLYKANPESFVKLVEGNSPKEVEKIFGPGSYDIAKEMSGNAMKTLRSVSGEVKRDIKIGKQATAGQQAYKELLDANTGKFRFPSFFSAKTTAANAALEKLESRLGKKVMDTLTNASKSGKSLEELLNTMPAVERVKILRALSTTEAPAGTAVSAINALAPENRNKLGR